MDTAAEKSSSSATWSAGRMPSWVEKRKRKKKLIKVGERRVTAEVLGADRKGFVCLSVCKCEILTNLTARVLEPYKKGDGIRRARHTIGRGSGERARMERRRRAGACDQQVSAEESPSLPGCTRRELCLRRVFFIKTSPKAKQVVIVSFLVHTG
jgi:hypothetical protein